MCPYPLAFNISLDNTRKIQLFPVKHSLASLPSPFPNWRQHHRLLHSWNLRVVWVGKGPYNSSCHVHRQKKAVCSKELKIWIHLSWNCWNNWHLHEENTEYISIHHNILQILVCLKEGGIETRGSLGSLPTSAQTVRTAVFLGVFNEYLLFSVVALSCQTSSLPAPAHSCWGKHGQLIPFPIFNVPNLAQICTSPGNNGMQHLSVTAFAQGFTLFHAVCV